MADAGAKCVIFFEAQGGSAPTGWTETFYLLGGPSAPMMKNIFATYVPLRVDLLGVGATMQAVRLSSVPATRATLLQYLTPGQGVGKTFSVFPADDYDPTQVDLLLRIQDQAGKRRQFWLGGLPDSITVSLVQNGILGRYIWAPGFTQFTQSMIDAGFCIRWKSGGVAPNFTYTATPFFSIQLETIRNRKRGRPFDLFHGRRQV